MKFSGAGWLGIQADYYVWKLFDLGNLGNGSIATLDMPVFEHTICKSDALKNRNAKKMREAIGAFQSGGVHCGIQGV